ncbi:ribonuclease H2 subunit A-like isoform X2 [Paramacrobiotus metropolitanus]|nr:ribonuclease H2 subunit A-like isoform X2 [Paramacrobiotus metropolitanus]
MQSAMELEDFHQDNTKNFVLKSVLPASIGKEDVIIGIDEAGRGPVLGPMVYGACYVAKKSEGLLSSVKVADSKTLTEEQRNQCFANLHAGADNFGWMAQILSPAVISKCMLSRAKYNLNAISHDSAMFLIQSVLDLEIRVAGVYLDTVGDPSKYQAKLRDRFPHIPDIVVSKKADSLFPVVSAASIVAKVCRDKALREWKFREGEKFLADLNYGSGYPSDPETKRFLDQFRDHVFGYPQLIRFSWSTTETALEKAASVTWEEVVEVVNSSTPSIMNFFKREVSQGTSSVPHQHQFFTDRRLKAVAQF